MMSDGAREETEGNSWVFYDDSPASEVRNDSQINTVDTVNAAISKAMMAVNPVNTIEGEERTEEDDVDDGDGDDDQFNLVRNLLGG